MANPLFPDFFGNAAAQQVLQEMIHGGRIPQTLLLAGPEGVGKATLARRFAAALLGDADRIEHDDLSLTPNLETIAEREKMTAEKRNETPLVFQTHPDFLTFCPEGPLRQISIQQIRLLKERAQFSPLKGQRRVFLLDRVDRCNDSAANSLLKILEEPPAYLIVILTAQNAYDLLPTIRSRSVPLYLSRLSSEEMSSFAKRRGLTQAERRIRLAAGSPGLAAAWDLERYDKQRAAMLALLGAGAGILPWQDWAKTSESLNAARSEKLENYLNVLYLLLEDLLFLQQQQPETVRNADILRELSSLAAAVPHRWIAKAVAKTDELTKLLTRNIQRGVALDAMVLELREAA